MDRACLIHHFAAHLDLNTVGPYITAIGIAGERPITSRMFAVPSSLEPFDHGCTGTSDKATDTKVGAVSPRPFLLFSLAVRLEEATTDAKRLYQFSGTLTVLGLELPICA